MWTEAKLGAALDIDALEVLVVWLGAHEPLAALLSLVDGLEDLLLGQLWGSTDHLLAVVGALQLVALAHAGLRVENL